MDGPDNEGEMFERTAKLSDKIPEPYANEKAARASNNGALPTGLSLIIKACENGANYLCLFYINSATQSPQLILRWLKTCIITLILLAGQKIGV